MSKNKILWVHNFDPQVHNSGIFMHRTYDYLLKQELHVDIIYSGNIKKISNFLKFTRYLIKISGKYDLIHFQYGSLVSLSSLFIIGPKILIYLRGGDLLLQKCTWLELPHMVISSILTIISIFRANAIITVSDRITKIADFYNIRRVPVYTLPSPIHPEDSENLNGESILDKKFIRIGTVLMNVHNRNKRIDVIEEAIKLLNSKGTKEYRLELITGTVHSEAIKKIASCDILVCSSFSEGWPNFIKEGLMLNVPFISSNVSDLKEIALRTDNCKVLDTFNSYSLSKAIESCIANYKAGDLKRFIIPFYISNYSRKMLEIYEEIN